MIDINFYMKVSGLKKYLMSGGKMGNEELATKLESYQSKEPIVYNIETTNRCNMRCQMCPRTTMMTRKLETMDMDTFARIVEQIVPFTRTQWRMWKDFVESHYFVPWDNMSENHFFLYVIPRVITLHGYGDPLLDPLIAKRVALLTERGIPSYFSCNPANIDLRKTEQIFDAGLDFVKYSIEAVDDDLHKEVRGQKSNFTESYRKILRLITLKEKHGYKTTIVITMLDLGKPWTQEQWELLQLAFKGLPVYIYLKSQDTKWYHNGGIRTKSIHWLEPCQFPWSSMTIKSNGECCQCVEDFNNEIILGNVNEESLRDIWNGNRYRLLRQDHLNLRPGIRCTERCDMALMGEYVED